MIWNIQCVCVCVRRGLARNFVVGVTPFGQLQRGSTNLTRQVDNADLISTRYTLQHTSFLIVCLEEPEPPTYGFKVFLFFFCQTRYFRDAFENWLATRRSQVVAIHLFFYISKSFIVYLVSTYR